jgi:peptidoglycan/xylan/chitin deacetylase (PgdA/CDA1 family)
VYAAVHPMTDVPDGAEAIARITDTAGAHVSWVLHFPQIGAVVLPFDPDAAIDAFRYEEWIPAAERSALPKPLLDLYYTVAKPLMPKALKQRLRRGLAHRALASPTSLQWPIDDGIDGLQKFLLRLIMIATGRDEIEFTWFWPDAHAWAVTLTHDVESAAGLACVPRVMELESARGIRSSFNMVAHDYEVSDEMLGTIRDAGFEVGVHGYTHDGLMFSNRDVFQRRIGPVNEYARRVGAVGFRSPATYRNHAWMQDLEIEYDSSFSNSAPCEPQPGGCASLFPYRMGGFTELPITVPMDHTLFELLELPGPDTWLACLERIKAAGGMACMLAHPDPAPGYIGVADNEAAYVSVLDSLAGSGAWVALPRDLARWWRERESSTAEQIAALDGAALGRAVLEPSGRVTLLPPVR